MCWEMVLSTSFTKGQKGALGNIPFDREGMCIFIQTQNHVIGQISFFKNSFWPNEPLAFLIKNECEGVREKTRSGEELVNA